MAGLDRRPPRVFISYSHDSARHVDRVLVLSDRLRSDGIDATVDQYEPFPREGWIAWMRRQLRDADRVLAARQTPKGGAGCVTARWGSSLTPRRPLTR